MKAVLCPMLSAFVCISLEIQEARPNPIAFLLRNSRNNTFFPYTYQDKYFSKIPTKVGINMPGTKKPKRNHDNWFLRFLLAIYLNKKPKIQPTSK